MSQTQANVDLNEVAKFDALASSWWDLEGQSKPLHDLNPIRLAYIADRTSLDNANVIDVGCGGGILSEALAKSGANVTGIDMGEMPLNIAKLHALEAGLTINYQHITAEEMASQQPEYYDVVTCLEMLEHVPDPASIIQACADMVKPGGDVFFSTLNRHPKAYLLAVLGAEYVMKMLPKGTHDYKRFIRPAELSAWCRQAGLKTKDITGMNYNPLTRQFSLGSDVKVNYLIHCKKI
ncbi:MAG: bifunctional 3-demethylubiquinol 3-O-methyltransferase/2-polyprenyl-6-hydroxyphenol methylase [Methylophaga sp.]|uniref:bifunctional 2-polyprenyl-6-hydroxyphenol methylase/3-demethylubiquinol 3-O-methyltransferase UbiG n=1 Tax=Methylophaga sp. UBA678 TaxID=1946901 RepID=UPI000C6B9FBA|nr:bifunctional 2-polyprenyl-6-hydroxyphenol methylase/3-demethylubiquinol 3-O-methyltransferase UbiG [Methylophaga sp. UBA678]MAX53018.1 bifunctional 3-demethylubiquinol 3-O-methyltransferase/2-polyprenyl-6-hydroxyphenol methylase [Methylophaga sp.]|tara:strand:- start:4354 stop:5061 length:708 start_codon:yes stop_codon:yes gene_type:complete